MRDKINHPDHYTWLKEVAGIEVIDITRHMDFDLGSALKYILRAGRKHEAGMSNDDKRIEDLKKARWYLDDEIGRLERQNGGWSTSKVERTNDVMGAAGVPNATPPSETEPGYDFVDLGLSVKWAAHNVEDIATQLKNRTMLHDHGKYRDCDSFCSGGRVPTKAEFDELINNCYYGWTKNGGKFTSMKNGNSVYFPADGYFNEELFTSKGRGVHGYYWSSTPDLNDIQSAWCLVVDADECDEYLIPKDQLLSIRLVQDYEGK